MQIPSNVESQIDAANAEETRLQIPSSAAPVPLILSPSTPVSLKLRTAFSDLRATEFVDILILVLCVGWKQFVLCSTPVGPNDYVVT